MKIQQLNNVNYLNQQFNIKQNSRYYSTQPVENDSVSFKAAAAKKSFFKKLAALLGFSAAGVAAKETMTEKNNDNTEVYEADFNSKPAVILARAFKNPEDEGSVEVIKQFLDSPMPEYGIDYLELKDVFKAAEPYSSEDMHLTKEEFINGLKSLPDDYKKKLLLDRKCGANYEATLNELSKEFIPELYQQALEENKAKVNAIAEIFDPILNDNSIQTTIVCEDGTTKRLKVETWETYDIKKGNVGYKINGAWVHHDVKKEFADIISDIEEKGNRIQTIYLYDDRTKAGQVKPIYEANSEKLNSIKSEYTAPHIMLDRGGEYDGEVGESMKFTLY